MSGDDCVVDRWLRSLSVSQRKVMIATSGHPADEWHPLMRDLFRCATLDLLRIMEEEAALFERIADRNVELARLDSDDPDRPAPPA